MSKAVKNMLVDDLKNRLQDVGDVIVVSLGQLDAQQTTQLRQTLRKKEISLQLVKNSLARRATAGTPLEPAMEDAAGMLALAWGGEDVVDLAKELDRADHWSRRRAGWADRLPCGKPRKGGGPGGLRTGLPPSAGVCRRFFPRGASPGKNRWYNEGLGDLGRPVNGLIPKRAQIDPRIIF
jgi:hypothetical protein